MQFSVVFDVDYFDDGREFRHSGSLTVNGASVEVPLGTIDLEPLVADEIERQLGRQLTDDELNLVSEDIYSMTNFDVSFPEQPKI